MEAGHIPRDPGDDLMRRRIMMQEIGNAVEANDFDFLVEMVGQQTLMRPFEIVAIMDVNQRRNEDPELAQKWRTGLELYLQVLDINDEIVKMPPKEIAIIKKIRERFKHEQTGASSEATAPAARQRRSESQQRKSDSHEKYNEEDIDWRNDNYQPSGITQEEVKHLSQTPIGRAVVSHGENAVKYADPDYLGEAYKTIAAFQLGSSEQLRRLLNIYTYSLADYTATQAIKYADPNYLKEAVEIARQHASDDHEVLAMEGSLDKYAYGYAKGCIENAAKYSDNDYIQQAISAIDQYVSSEARIKAMLSELGLA